MYRFKKHIVRPNNTKKDKGNWRFSFYQKTQHYNNNEQMIKRGMRPQGGFNPINVKDYINPEMTYDEKLALRVLKGDKLKSGEKIQYQNYLDIQKNMIEEDMKRIEFIKKNKSGDKPITNDGKLHLIFHFLLEHIKKDNKLAICNCYLKLKKDNFLISDKMKETYKVQINAMNKIVSEYDLTHLQFVEFYDTMPPLNQTGFVKFDDWQVNVVNNVDNKISTVVSAPTSAGKSVVAGYTLTKGRGLIVVPTDPLAWQWASYVGGFLEKDIPIVTKTYTSIPKDKCECKDAKNRRSNLSCKMCTRSPREKIIEHLDNSVAIVGTPNDLLDYLPLLVNKFDWIVFDEIHMIGKNEGSAMEVIAKIYNDVNFLALSATIGNLDEVTTWFQKLNPKRNVQSIYVDKRFFNLQRYYFSTENGNTVLHPLALVKTSDFKDGTILKKSLQPTPRDIWALYEKLNAVYDLAELKHTSYFGKEEIVILDKANSYFLDLIEFMVENYDELKTESIINSFYNNALIDEDINLVDFCFKLKEENKTPAVIFLKDALPTQRIVRKFTKIIEKMEDDKYPDLFQTRKNKQKEARRIDKKTEKEKKEEQSQQKTMVKIINGKTVETKITKDKKNSREMLQMNEDGTFKCESDIKIDCEGLFQPHEDFIFTPFLHFKEDQITQWANELKTWFPYDGSQFHFIIRLLWRGVGVYTKGLPDPYLRIVQQLSSQKKLAIVFSDISLVFGVSMPFRTSVIYRDNLVPDDLDAMLYHQMAGRAGRRGLDKEGNVIFCGYSWQRIEELSVCPIPNIVGIDTTNFVIPQASAIAKLKNNGLDWEKVYKNPLSGDDEEELLQNLESLKENYRINVDNASEGWKFAYASDDINHLLMMWTLRNTEDYEPIIIANILPYIKRNFESLDSDNHQNQVLLAQFLSNFISIKTTNKPERVLKKCPIVSEVVYDKIFNDFSNLGIDISANTKIDNIIWESIKINKMSKTSTEKEANNLRERLLDFAQKLIAIQHYYYESKLTNLSKLFGKLLTRINWIYLTSSPLTKPFFVFDDDGEYKEVDDDEDEEVDEAEEFDDDVELDSEPE